MRDLPRYRRLANKMKVACLPIQADPSERLPAINKSGSGKVENNKKAKLNILHGNFMFSHCNINIVDVHTFYILHTFVFLAKGSLAWPRGRRTGMPIEFGVSRGVDDAPEQIGSLALQRIPNVS